ncbi:MAG: protein-tyrosine-phosphatase, partial [Stenotrophomonas sp.]
MKLRRTHLALAVVLGLPMLTGAGIALGRAPVADTTTAAPATTRSANVQPVAADAQRLIPLQGAWNTRTFAGLQGTHGPIPANAFVRTSDLGRLTAADRD